MAQTNGILDGPQEVFAFEVGGNRYGLPLNQVQEVIRAVISVPLPKAPRIVEGVINVRGTVFSVLDIRKRFNIPAKPVDPSDLIILAHVGNRPVALRADRVSGLLILKAGEVEDAKSIESAGEFVAGIAKLPDGLMLIHNLKSFLLQAEAQELEQALSSSGRKGKER